MALSDLSEIERRVLADLAAEGSGDTSGPTTALSSSSRASGKSAAEAREESRGEWVTRISSRGHPYSKNRHTGEVIWLKPKAQEDDWEEYVDETGERCYYNKVTGATLTACTPKTNAYAEEQWSQFVDGSGKLHVYNVVTGESTIQPDPNVDILRTRRGRKDSRTSSRSRFAKAISAFLGFR